MYGQTEATARISYVPPDMLSKKIDSIGIPIPSTELHVEKNDSQEGELIFEGDNVSMGYANDYKDLYLGDSRNGILKTGDIGFKDSDGYFYITGRKKRFIKINGIRLSLDDAEKLIENEFCSTGIDVRCIGEDDNLILEYTCVNNIDNDLKNYLCKKIKIHHKYLTIARVKNIMRNSSGKKIYT
jgi:acyl-coenzyme A synthetase/AMP-(fatty) acid ligase